MEKVREKFLIEYVIILLLFSRIVFSYDKYGLIILDRFDHGGQIYDCKNVKDDEYFFSASKVSGPFTMATLRVNTNPTLTALTNDEYGGIILGLDLLENREALVCGFIGFGKVSIDTGQTIVKHIPYNGEYIFEVRRMKNTEFCILGLYDSYKFSIHQTTDLAAIRTEFISVTQIYIIHQKPGTSLNHISGDSMNKIIMFDYTNFQEFDLVSQTVTSVFVIIQARTPQTILAGGFNDNRLYEVDDQEKAILKAIVTPDSNNHKLWLIFETKYVYLVTNANLVLVDLEKQTSEIFNELGGIDHCLDLKSLMIASTIGSNRDIGVFEMVIGSICSDDNCDLCGFVNQECLRCKTGTILDGTKCVEDCPEGKYFDETVNICRKDTCTGGKFYVPELETCMKCNKDEIFSEKELKCLKCQEEIKNCAQCLIKNNKFECKKCQRKFNIDKNNKCEKCDEFNPSCKKFDDNCNCLKYKCKTKGCTRCSKSPKICENKEVSSLRKKFSDLMKSILKIVDKPGPVFDVIVFAVMSNVQSYGSPLIAAINRIAFNRKFLYINLEKGELVKSYLYRNNTLIQKINYENMRSVANKIFEYNLSLFPTFTASAKIILLLIFPLVWIGLQIKKKKNLKSQFYWNVVFHMKNICFLLNLSSATDLSFYLPLIISNLDKDYSRFNFYLYWTSVVVLIIHSSWMINYLLYSLSLRKNDVRIPLEDLHNSSRVAEGPPIDDGEIDIQKTKVVAENHNFSVITYLRNPIRTKDGFSYSRYFQIWNIARNQIYLSLVTGFSNFAIFTIIFAIIFEFKYIVTWIYVMCKYQCFRGIDFLLNIINSGYLLISFVIIFKLHLAEEKSIRLQEWLIYLNYSMFVVEYFLILLSMVIRICLNQYLDKNKEKRLKRLYAYVFMVIFIFKFLGR